MERNRPNKNSGTSGAGSAKKISTIIVVAILVLADGAMFFFIIPTVLRDVPALMTFSTSTVVYSSASAMTGTNSVSETALETGSDTPIVPVVTAVTSSSSAILPFVVTHVKAPPAIRAIYMTSWVAADKPFRDKIFNLITTSDLNAIVIDIKDSMSRTIFEVPDIADFIAQLHAKGIYVIGRMTTFEDPVAAKTHPDWAVQTTDGAVWKNSGGISWIDAGATPFWDYIAGLGKQAYADGFDEINFDYVRFPSDGNMANISFPYSEGKSKAVVINNFFTYLDTTFHPLGIPISADLFGETTTDHDDMGIGQVLENALVHFDYVDPMVYPSHFANGWDGWKNPAEHPYEIIDYSMGQAVAREKKLEKADATSTTPMLFATLRPWLQDFNLGATYTPAMVQSEIQATHDVGLDNWLMWNAGNIYNPVMFSKVLSTSSVAGS